MFSIDSSVQRSRAYLDPFKIHDSTVQVPCIVFQAVHRKSDIQIGSLADLKHKRPLWLGLKIENQSALIAVYAGTDTHDSGQGFLQLWWDQELRRGGSSDSRRLPSLHL